MRFANRRFVKCALFLGSASVLHRDGRARIPGQEEMIELLAEHLIASSLRANPYSNTSTSTMAGNCIYLRKLPFGPLGRIVQASTCSMDL